MWRRASLQSRSSNRLKAALRSKSMRTPLLVFIWIHASACSVLAPNDRELIGGSPARELDGASGSRATGGAAGEGKGGSTGGGAGDAAGTSSGGTAGGSAGGAAGTSDGNGGAGEAGAPVGDVPPSGLLLWLRAGSGVEVDENEQVIVWRDQSGRGHDAAQESSAARPSRLPAGIGQNPALEFDGVNDFMQLPAGFADFAAGLSFFAVVQLLANANCPTVLELSNEGEQNDISFIRYSSTFQYEVDEQDVRAENGTYTVGTPHLVAVVHSPDEAVLIHVDSASVRHDAVRLPPPITRVQNRIARSEYVDEHGDPCELFEGRLGELMLYARAVTPAERRAIETYLSDQWRLDTP
jgi:hypothetical protein